MIILNGIGASTGSASGFLSYLSNARFQISKESQSSVNEEYSRYQHAVAAASEQIQQMALDCRSIAGDLAADIFEAYAAMVEDTEFASYVKELLAQENCSTEYAVSQAGAFFSQVLSQSDSEYLQARAYDITDVTNHLLSVLTKTKEPEITLTQPTILVANHITLSQLMQLSGNHLAGIISLYGSANSHTAILAKALEIPAICKIEGQWKNEYDGRQADMNAANGTVRIS